MPSKFPLVVVLTEFAAQLRKLRLNLDLQWIPRNQNEEADALTNCDFGAFSEDRRIHVNISELKCLVLDEMFRAADSLNADMKDRRAAQSAGTGAPAKSREQKQAPLREREPW